MKLLSIRNKENHLARLTPGDRFTYMIREREVVAEQRTLANADGIDSENQDGFACDPNTAGGIQVDVRSGHHFAIMARPCRTPEQAPEHPHRRDAGAKLLDRSGACSSVVRAGGS